jgi:hypothetical protein
MTDEEYVRARVIKVGNDGTPRHPIPVLLGKRFHNGPCGPEWDDGWAEARAAVDERERQIAEVEEEIALLRNVMIVACLTNGEMRDNERIHARLLAVEQDRLKALQAGMREVKW